MESFYKETVLNVDCWSKYPASTHSGDRVGINSADKRHTAALPTVDPAMVCLHLRGICNIIIIISMIIISMIMIIIIIIITTYTRRWGWPAVWLATALPRCQRYRRSPRSMTWHGNIVRCQQSIGCWWPPGDVGHEQALPRHAHVGAVSPGKWLVVLKYFRMRFPVSIELTVCTVCTCYVASKCI